MFDLFKKEIIWSVIAFIFAMLYLLMDDGGKCVFFMVIAVYAASKMSNFIVGEKDGENIFDRSGDISVGDGYRIDNE